ncbi:hypothetical protein PMAYCL1PPCAC_01413, partial [Pristionchus mayeri]
IYLFLTTRVVFLLYQIRIVELSDYVDFPTFLILAMSLTRFYIGYAMVFLLVAVVVERGFATILVHDYETRDRYWFAIVEISLIVVLSLTFSINYITVAFNFLPWYVGYIVIFSFSGSAGLIAVFLYINNSKNLRKISNSNTRYTLPMRY